jgi:hypothetical protein
MPNTSTWSNKDERMYEHIKDSSRKRGESAGRAEEIAARTVNRHRRQHGKTREQYEERHARGGGRSGGSKASGSSKASSASKGSGDLENRSKSELYNLARKRGVEGRSRMDKRQLAKALRK